MADGAYGMSSYRGGNDALQEALRKLANLDAENSLLRRQVSDANERNDDLNVCFRTTEIELKHAMKKEAERFQKEANLRVRDMASLNRNHAGALSQVANLRQQLSNYQKSQQKSQSEMIKLKVESNGLSEERKGNSQRSYSNSISSKSNQSLPTSSQSGSSAYADHSRANNKYTLSSNDGGNVVNAVKVIEADVKSEVNSDAGKSAVLAVDLRCSASLQSASSSTAVSEELIDAKVATEAKAPHASIQIIKAEGAPTESSKCTVPATAAILGNSGSCESRLNNLRAIVQDLLTCTALLVPKNSDCERTNASKIMDRKSYILRNLRQTGCVAAEGVSETTLSGCVEAVQATFQRLIHSRSRPMSLRNTLKSSHQPSDMLRLTHLAMSLCDLSRCLSSDLINERGQRKQREIESGSPPFIRHSSERGKKHTLGDHINCDKRSMHVCIDRKGECLLYCLASLCAVIDNLTSNDIAAMCTARKSLQRVTATGTKGNSSGSALSSSSSSANSLLMTTELKGKFEKEAEFESLVGNEAQTPHRQQSASDAEGNGAATSARQTSSTGSRGPCNITPGGSTTAAVSTIMRDRGSANRHQSTAARGHSGSKASVTFSQHGHETPPTRSKRNGSIDEDSLPPSASTVFDASGGVQKRARIRGSSHRMGDVCSGMMSFPLTSLHMPNIPVTVLSSTYDDVTAFSSKTNSDPVELRGRSTSDSSAAEILLSEYDSSVHFPGRLVSALQNIMSLLHALTPLGGGDRDEQILRSSLLDMLIRIMRRIYRGDSTSDSLCSSEDLIPLLGATTGQSQSHDLHHQRLDVKGSPSSSAAAAAAAQSGVSLPLLFSFAALPPCLKEKGVSSDEVDGLINFERAAIAGCKTALSDCTRQQLEAESDLLAILLEILKNKKAFRHFAACQLRDRDRGTEITCNRGEKERQRENRLISRLCLRLLLNDTDRDRRQHVSGPGSRGHCVLRAKLQVVRFLYGLVAAHGLEAIAAIFGVEELPSCSPPLSTHEDSALTASTPKANSRAHGTSPSSSEANGPGVAARGGAQSVDNSAVHCLCVCWMLTTRTLDLCPHSLSPEGLLLAELADGVGRLLDLMAGHVAPKQWSNLINLRGDEDDEMISRQMSKRALHNVHPELLRQCKDNPISNLW